MKVKTKDAFLGKEKKLEQLKNYLASWKKRRRKQSHPKIYSQVSYIVIMSLGTDTSFLN